MRECDDQYGLHGTMAAYMSVDPSDACSLCDAERVPTVALEVGSEYFIDVCRACLVELTARLDHGSRPGASTPGS